MIRLATQDDTAAVMTLAEASGLFRPPELEELGGELTDYFGGDQSRPHFWLTDDDGDFEDGLMSVAYCAPEVMTDGTWNLLFVAVRPDFQGQGHGAALVRYIEQLLTRRGERILLVETSGTDDFRRTRAFYRKYGFEEEARIRDYYRAGDDKIIFRKDLSASER